MWPCAVRPRGSPVQTSTSGEYSPSSPAGFSSEQPELSCIRSGLINHNTTQQNKVNKLGPGAEPGSWHLYVGASRVEATQTTSKPCCATLEAGVPTKKLWSLETEGQPCFPNKGKQGQRGCESILHKHFTAIILFDSPNNSVMSARNPCPRFIDQEAEAQRGKMICPRIRSQ